MTFWKIFDFGKGKRMTEENNQVQPGDMGDQNDNPEIQPEETETTHERKVRLGKAD